MAKNTKPTEAAVAPVQQQSDGLICPFNNYSSFEQAWRMSAALSCSSIVPTAFRGEQGQANCLIALELASRLQTSVFMIMQHLYIIKGKPAFSSQFMIAAIQNCHRFSALKYKKRLGPDGTILGCRAYATELASGEVLEGPEVTMEMAKREGWLSKDGSKWVTMPEVMMQYRAAAFFGRLYAPDVMLGFRSEDEVRDIEPAGSGAQAPAPFPQRNDKTAELNAIIEAEEEKQETAGEESPAVEETTEAPAADELVLKSEEVA